MKQIFNIFILVFFILSCGKHKTVQMNLKELHGTVIDVPPNTFLLTIKANGKAECPVYLSLVSDARKYKPPYVFNGEIDTLFRNDWYESKLSFDVEPLECSGAMSKSHFINKDI